MTKYISNAFSLQMVANAKEINLNITEIEKPTLDELKEMTSAIGHADLANILGVECNRINISLKGDDVLYVAQLIGGRLPEGTTTLPEGFSLKWYKITIK